MTETRFTPSGVRLIRHASRPGRFNWLLLPGGPGIGSESLTGLADAMEVPGTVWRVDLPGDGSNQQAPGAPADPFEVWPGVLIEAADAVADPVFVGHSTGGMYLLSTPELEEQLAGLVLVSTAPDASWKPRFVAMTQAHPLPAVDAAFAVYEDERTDARLGDIAVASAEWNFTAAGVDAGRALLAAMPYCRAAVDWSDASFDDVYQAAWWPAETPTLILGGAQDRIVWQGLWDEARFQGANVTRAVIPDAAHFPWIENPAAVREAFAAFAARLG